MCSEVHYQCIPAPWWSFQQQSMKPEGWRSKVQTQRRQVSWPGTLWDRCLQSHTNAQVNTHTTLRTHGNVHETDSRSVGCIKNYTWQCFVNSVVSLSADIYRRVFKPLRAPHLRRSLPAQPTGALFCLAPCADATPDLKPTGESI